MMANANKFNRILKIYKAFKIASHWDFPKKILKIIILSFKRRLPKYRIKFSS
jgi:hypothetical protein